jgi:hypothetical protein
VEAFGPDRLTTLTPDLITERARAFKELAAIPKLMPVQAA